jgi:hypothetical protein
MDHRFQCACGGLRGEVAPQGAVRAVCYCGDCQAYAYLLREPARVLDAAGGTDIVATAARNVRFTAGAANLACLSLSPRGLLRWYARCCETPIGNTPRDWKLPYVGLVHSCLHQPDPLEQSFPRVHLRVNTHGAHGPIPRDVGWAGKLHFAGTVLRLGSARLTGSYRSTPFFDTSGAPVVQPRVASREEVEAARRAAKG